MKARFTGSAQLLFNLPRSLKMSPISRVWSSLLLCMFALVVLKSQHGKINILLVILAHLWATLKHSSAMLEHLQQNRNAWRFEKAFTVLRLRSRY